MIGVYEWLNKATNKSYIGSSLNLTQRKGKHLCLLRANKHTNKHLQSAFNKYGEHSFEFRIVQETTKTELREVEQFWIDFYNATNDSVGYNILKVAGTSTGYTHTNEAKVKITNSKLHTWYGFISPIGEEVVITNLTQFCKDNNLNKAAMSEVYHGSRRRKSYKGWTRIDNLTIVG